MKYTRECEAVQFTGETFTDSPKWLLDLFITGELRWGDSGLEFEPTSGSSDSSWDIETGDWIIRSWDHTNDVYWYEVLNDGSFKEIWSKYREPSINRPHPIPTDWEQILKEREAKKHPKWPDGDIQQPYYPPRYPDSYPKDVPPGTIWCMNNNGGVPAGQMTMVCGGCGQGKSLYEQMPRDWQDAADTYRH
jgi:hypothetical protein